MFRTIGEIVDEDVGVDGVHLGLNKSQIEKCTLHSARSKRWVMTQSAMPSFMKSRVNDRPTHFIKVMIVFSFLMIGVNNINIELEYSWPDYCYNVFFPADFSAP